MCLSIGSYKTGRFGVMSIVSQFKLFFCKSVLTSLLETAMKGIFVSESVSLLGLEPTTSGLPLGSPILTVSPESRAWLILCHMNIVLVGKNKALQMNQYYMWATSIDLWHLVILCGNKGSFYNEYSMLWINTCFPYCKVESKIKSDLPLFSL